MEKLSNYSFISFTLLGTSLSKIRHGIDSYFGEAINDKKYKIRAEEFKMEKIYKERPFKGGLHLKRVAFFNPKICEKKSIMFSNSSDGWVTLANYLSSELNCYHISFYLTISENDDSMQNMFIYKDNEEERVVYSMKEEGKWVFFQEGAIQNFENPKNYKKRRISERLNFTILVDYCTKLGLDITNDSFWESNNEALYLEETTLNRN